MLQALGSLVDSINELILGSSLRFGVMAFGMGKRVKEIQA
jgi:hypothetical protein